MSKHCNECVNVQRYCPISGFAICKLKKGSRLADDVADCEEFEDKGNAGLPEHYGLSA